VPLSPAFAELLNKSDQKRTEDGSEKGESYSSKEPRSSRTEAAPSSRTSSVRARRGSR